MAERFTFPIHFFFKDVSPTLKNREKLRNFIGKSFKKEGKRVRSLNYIFCNDRELLEINRKYLNHDFYTDVISFDLSEADNEIIGEIYISFDRVRENARALGMTIREELHRVMFHGSLHLCGYGDKSAGEIKEIRTKENEWLSNYFNS